ncbi:MAG TPA: PspC domain-containing protein [Myxococcales bacterium]|nr:PspC domain-containing protein [Myxococcales bacterium]
MDKKTCPTCRSEIDTAALRCPNCRARQPDMPSMHRDVPGRLLAGVCAAISRELQVDATLVRVVFAVACLVSGGMAFGAYAMIWLLTPFKAGGKTPASRLLDWMEGLLRSPTAPQPDRDERAQP